MTNLENEVGGSLVIAALRESSRARRSTESGPLFDHVDFQFGGKKRSWETRVGEEHPDKSDRAGYTNI